MDIKSKNPIIAALTKKVPPKHGVPAFVLLLALAVGLVYYRHRHSSSPTAATSTANVADTSGTDTSAPFYGYGSGSTDTGGGGGGGDNSGNTQPAQAPVSWDPAQFAAAVAADMAPQDQPPSNDPPPGSTDPGGGNSTTTTTTTGTVTRTVKPSQPYDPAKDPASAFQAGGPGGSHLVQPLRWGGQTFYTQADFDAWARKHGSSVKAELAKHPEATNIYNHLGSNDMAAATVPSPAAVKAAGGGGSNNHTSNVSSAPAPAPQAAPKPAPAPVQIRTKVGGTATPLPSTNKRLGKI